MRSLTIAVSILALGLAGCWNDCSRDQAGTSAPDQVSEVAQLKHQLATVERDLSNTKLDLGYAQRNRDSAYERVKERDESADHLANYMLNPKGLSAHLGKGIEKLLTSTERNLDIVEMVRGAAYETLGQYGQDVVVRIMDNLVANPDLTRAVYETAKPAIMPIARMLNVRFDTLPALVTKPYDPFMGALAATEGHKCRSEFGASADQKTEHCKKVFTKLSTYYGVEMDMNLIKTLGVMHRRYINEDAGTHDGFNRLRYVAKDILDELQKKP